MVEDDVLNHAQTGVVQAHHHLPVFHNPVIRIEGISSMRSEVVDGAVAKVVIVCSLNGRHRSLLFGAVGYPLRSPGDCHVVLSSLMLPPWKVGII